MSVTAFFQRAGDIGNTNMGFIGQVLSTGSAKRSYTGSNERPQANQVTTVAISGATNSTVYQLLGDGIAASYTSDGSASQDEIGAGLVAAWNTKPSLRRKMVASYTTGSNSIVLTGVWPGLATVVTKDDASSGDLGSPSTSTAAADGARVYFGRVLASDGVVTNGKTPKVFIPTTTLFSPQVKTFTYGSVASGDSVVTTVEMNGAYVRVSTAFDTNQTTTLSNHASALETELNAIFGAARGAAAAATATTITITADVAGAEFVARSDVEGSGGGTVSPADTTGPSPSTSLARALAGISVRRLDVENETIDGDDPSYAPNAGVEVLSRGAIIMARSTSETWALGDSVWVDLTTVLTSAGRIYNAPASATSPVYLPPGLIRIERGEPSTQSNGVGVAHVTSTAIGA